MKILITGGHITPALAIIDELQSSKKEAKIVFVGRKHAIDKEKVISFEYQETVKRKVPFINIDAGRLSRIISLRSFIKFIKFPLGIYQAFVILKKEKPDKILTFGSYVGLPVCLAAYFYRIPIYIHEQTIAPGLANKIISLWAKKVFCSFRESLAVFPKSKTVFSGNPVRKEIFLIKKRLKLKKDRPVIYVTGGSTCSHSINLHIEKIIDKLLDKYTVIHQTGETKQYKDYERLSQIKNSNYFLAKYFFDDQIGFVFSISDLVVSRVGANTFFELLVLKKPAIFIPLPWSANHEQLKQGDFFKKNRLGEIFDQDQPSDQLLILIDKTMAGLDQYKNNFNQLKYLNEPNSAKVIISEIFKD